MRGATLGPIENSQHPGVGYGTPASAAALDELVALGCNWVSFTPFGRQWDLDETDIRLDFEAPFDVNRESVKRVIAQAHARGLRVLLIPHLWVDMGGWRGEIAHRDALLPIQHDSPSDDAQHADRHTPVEILAENEPGEQGGQHPFEREEQRSRRSIKMRKPDHEQHGPRNAAAQNAGREPWQIAACEARFGRFPVAAAKGAH